VGTGAGRRDTNLVPQPRIELRVVGSRNHSLVCKRSRKLCKWSLSMHTNQCYPCNGQLTRNNQVRHVTPWEGGHTAGMHGVEGHDLVGGTAAPTIC